MVVKFSVLLKKNDWVWERSYVKFMEIFSSGIIIIFFRLFRERWIDEIDDR